MDVFFRLKKYVEYQWKAKTKYYIHSPFVYQFYLNVLEGNDEIPVKSKSGKFLYRITKYFDVQNILVFGDSDSYLQCFVLANPSAKIATLNTLQSPQLDYSIPVDLVLCNGNFSKQTILDCFDQSVLNMNENSIFILSDIHRTKDLHKTWEEIKAHTQVTLTVDVFQFGICFFRKDKLAKENFVLRY